MDNSDQLSQDLITKSKQILEAKNNLNLVMESLYESKKTVVERTEVSRKAKFVLSKLLTEEKLLEREYWSSKK